MPRVLWLVYERLPHPDAVSHPACEDEARLVLELLEHPYARRLHLADQLRNYLAEQHRLPIFARQTIPCRRATGLYHPIPWRLAKWLSMILPAQDSVIARTRTRIQTWLDAGEDTTLLRPSA